MRHLARDSAFTVLIESRQQAPVAGRRGPQGADRRRALFKAGAALLLAAALLAAMQPLRAQATTHRIAIHPTTQGEAPFTSGPNVNHHRMDDGGFAQDVGRPQQLAPPAHRAARRERPAG